MGRPAGISVVVERILKAEAERLQKKSEDAAGPGLDDLELSRLQKLLLISQLLVNPAKVNEFPEMDVDSIVEELKPKKDPTLFPARGRKSTATIYEPET